MERAASGWTPATPPGRARYEWLPDPARFHSGEALVPASAEAIDRLVRATPLTIEALTAPATQPNPIDDEGPWETVQVVLDPLRAAQERALLAAIAPAEPQTHSIGL